MTRRKPQIAVVEVSATDLAISAKLLDTRRALASLGSLVAAREGLTPMSDEQRKQLFEVVRLFANEVADEEDLVSQISQQSG
jgi:hypothetical protein